jgi:hypothetical protein
MDASNGFVAPQSSNPADATKLSELESLSQVNMIELRLNAAAKPRRAAAENLEDRSL